MEECPVCKKWTFSYNPRAEMKVCFTCNHVEQLSYDSFLVQKNIIEYLKYPCFVQSEAPKQAVPIIRAPVLRIKP